MKARQTLPTYPSPASLGFVSTYTPTKCGLATFTHSLVSAVTRGENASVGVVRVVENEQDVVSPIEVIGHLDPSRPVSVARTAKRLGKYDVAVIQHEFGIFGPDDGAAVLDLLERLTIPAIVVLHTVPIQPSMRQWLILDRILRLAGSVVVMSQGAQQLLTHQFSNGHEKIHVIPHGAHGYARQGRRTDEQPVILTWGLLGPGKGIEWGIEALSHLKDLKPRPVYRIAGQTHPNVLRHEGEAYRDSLLRRACELNVQEQVDFRNAYLDSEALERLVSSADIVLLPYDSREQATSGVLIDALAAHKPVVSTRFPHSQELLSGGAGLLVHQQDAAQMSAALRLLLTDDHARDTAVQQARELSRALSWPAVAERYVQLADTLTHQPASAVA